jgi:hypothetical protein
MIIVTMNKIKKEEIYYISETDVVDVGVGEQLIMDIAKLGINHEETLQYINIGITKDK